MLLELLLQMLKLQAYIIWDGAVLVFFPYKLFSKIERWDGPRGDFAPVCPILFAGILFYLLCLD